jgi:predicted metalloprotease with PDZ domain
MRIRELTDGARSLDDFSRAFFAARAVQGWVSTYEFRDVVAALHAVAPFDWDALLRQRVQGTDQPVGEGLQRAGWRLVYDDTPNAYLRDGEKARRNADFGYSLGLTVNRDAVLTDVVWGGPAFTAGLANGTTLVAVQGRAYSTELLTDALRQAQKDGTPIELLVKTQDRYRTVRIDYREGVRLPRLERVAGSPDRLADLLKARTPAAPLQAP